MSEIEPPNNLDPGCETNRAASLEMLKTHPAIRKMGRQVVMQELARRNFQDFAQYVRPGLSMPAFHRNYYRLLELFARGHIKRLMITMPPQHGKSLASSVLLPSWILGGDPDKRIAVASYNATLAVRFNRHIQRVLSSDEYGMVFPASALKRSLPRHDGYVRTGEQLDIPKHEGGVFAVGREGTLTGNSVDVFILDDLYKDAMEANSPIVRENCWEWYTSVVKTRLHNFSQELIVFTRWHEEDLIGRIYACEKVVELHDWAQLDSPVTDDWVHLNFEALKQSAPTIIDPRASGEPLWSERHDAALLNSKRRLDPQRFDSLYQGRPASEEGFLYGQKFLTYERLPDDPVKCANYTDTADMGEDFLCSVCYVVGRDGFIYVTDVVYSQQPMEITEELVAQMLTRNATRMAYVESNNGGRGFARALSRLLPSVEVEWFHQSGNKEARILSNSATLLRTVLMPRDWAVRWQQWHSHLVEYRRNYRTNRWHDAPDALTGVVEKETGMPKRIRAIKFRS